MAAFFWSPPSAEDMVRAGYLEEDVPPPPPVELWPDHVEAFHLFAKNHTQWRFGPAGATGLDYPVFFHEMDRAGLSNAAYDETMGRLRIIEQAALSIFHKKS